MTRIVWTTDRHVKIAGCAIPVARQFEEGYHQETGVVRCSRRSLLLKRLVWPIWKVWADLSIDGFIEWEIGKLIRNHLQSDTVFLEIGCGDMSLMRYLTLGVCYNAIDLRLSEFHFRRVLATNSNVNVAIASATDIPAASNIATLVVSTETFEHIPKIDLAIAEIHRVATPGGTLICSIPNNYSWKYQKKGPHSAHINDWTFQGFIQFMDGHGFELVDGFMKGYWIPLPLWVTRTSYQLPITSKSETYNTNFFYTFRVRK